MKTILHSTLLLCFTLSVFAAEPKPLVQPEHADLDARSTLREGMASVSDENIQIRLGFSAPPTEWVHVFLDADGDLDTGFIYSRGVSPSPGWDLLIEGNILYKYAGNAAGEWKWQQLESPVTLLRQENAIQISFPRTALPVDSSIRILAATYSEDYSTALDFLPRGSTSWELITPASPVQSSPAIVPRAPARVIDRRAAFDKIKTYACYYGADQVDRLSKRDAVIIETRRQPPENIAKMQAADTLVIGYISIGEDGELRIGDAQGPGGFDSGYFDRDEDGAPDKNPTWNSYYADARQPAWRRYFLETAYNMRTQHGVDGFFLDTVDTSELYPNSKAAMISLIRELRYQNPESIIIINRGFHTVEPLGADIDGVMFESFTASWDWGKTDYILMRPSAWDWGLEVYRDILKPAMDENGLVVLVLDYAESGDAEAVQVAFDRAVTFGYVPEIANIYLDQIYDITITGKPDPKYMEIQTTPESMSYTLEESRNGFPKGTVITPSSSYPDYEVAPIVDGIQDKDSINWRNRAWASWEKASPHYVEFTFPEPVTVRGLSITWAVDNGKSFPSADFRVESKNNPEEPWILLNSEQGNRLAKNTLDFEPVTSSILRVYQPAEGGSELRPNLMWIESIVIVTE